MARKPNYDFEKRRKEIERKAKKDEKLRRKRESAESAESGEGGEGGAEGGDEADTLSAEDAAALGLVRPTPPKQP